MPHPNGRLTAGEIEPEAEDWALAEQLIAEGWEQTSAKYRNVARLVKPFPRPEDVLRADALDTTAAAMILDRWDRYRSRAVRYFIHTEHVEQRTLTVRQFRAYKLIQRRARGW